MSSGDATWSSSAEAGDKGGSNALSTRKSTVASLLAFLSASGPVFMSVYVFKSRSRDAECGAENFRLYAAPRATRRSWPRFYCWPGSEYLNKKAFQEFLDKLAAEWAVRNPSVLAVLFGDQLGAHQQPDEIETAMYTGLYLIFLPLNSSYVPQPLNEAPSAGLKRLTAAAVERGVIDGLLFDEGARNALLEAAFAAEVTCFTPRVITGAFQRCGQWPSDPDRMLAQVAAAVGFRGTDGIARRLAQATAS